MSNVLHKKSILKKTIEVGGFTLMSRFLGIIREVLTVKYFGAGAMSDAFFTAYKIPNSLRKIFAEGALSAAFIPTLVNVIQKDKRQVNSLMTLSFLVFQGFLLSICCFVFFKTELVLRLIVPGWFVGGEVACQFALPFIGKGCVLPAAWFGLGQPIAQVAAAASFLKILIAFIVFISSSALLAGALQAVNHFLIPAIAPVLLNIVFITGLIVCYVKNLSPEYLCYFILLGGLLQFCAHLGVYFYYSFSFASIDRAAWNNFKQVFKKFVPCLLSMSIMEISLFIDTSFASYLSKGSISLIYYANRFMGIPLGVFAVAFSTILLPHFSRVGSYAPKRLSFYLLESAKFVFWVTIPVTLIMGFFAEKIFLTIFLSKKFTMAQVVEAHTILIAFLAGLFFFSLNKILLNMYYALHNTRIPAIISFVATGLNVVMNAILIGRFQAMGLALATTISAMVQTILFVVLLNKKFKFKFYVWNFIGFVGRYVFQLMVILPPCWLLYYIVEIYIKQLPDTFSHFLIAGLGFWLWVGPICGLAFLLLFFLRNLFKVRLYFLD